jgi:glycosyltransferase involved in cell wall biosynthesis
MAQKIAIISFARNDSEADRFSRMMSDLNIPEDIDAEVFFINGADNAAAAFNQGMKAAEDIHFKMYIDCNVEILSSDLIRDGIRFLVDNPNIPMLGVTGTDQIHSDGVSYQGVHRINDLLLSGDNYLPGDYIKPGESVLLDGGVYFTSSDVAWREDLVETGYFLGPSQSTEFRRIGKNVEVLKTGKKYIRNQNDICDIPEHDRQNFLREYSKDILPLVSVIIPSSRPGYLKEALDSVLAQDYQNMEIFISDDAESGEAEKYVTEIQKTDDRVIYEHHPGYAATQNWDVCKAYDNSAARYVNWLMDDDLFLPGKISTMTDVMLDHPEVTVVSSVRYTIDAFGNRTGMYGLTEITQPVEMSGEEAALAVLSLNNFIGELSTGLIRKSAMLNGKDLGYKDPDCGPPDSTTWLKALESGDLYYFNRPYSCFRVHEGSSSMNLATLVNVVYAQGECIQDYAEKDVFLTDAERIGSACCVYLSRAGYYLRKAFEEGRHETPYVRNLLDQVKVIDDLMIDAVDDGMVNKTQMKN